MAGRTEIAIEVDAGVDDSISPAMADAAIPLEALANALQTPVHIIAAGLQTPPAKYCVIRLSLKLDLGIFPPEGGSVGAGAACHISF
jgi:hypothetical protein